MEHFMKTSSKRIWKTSDKSEAPLKKKSGIAWKHEVKKSRKCSYIYKVWSKESPETKQICIAFQTLIYT